MGMTIAIDKLYMNKMPNSCKECPLTYLDTGDDAYFGANERRCVIDDSCVDGMTSERAYDCPLVEAIPKADYENRLKADMIDTLEKLKKEMNLIKEAEYQIYGKEHWNFVGKCQNAVQQKIDKLRGEQA